MKNWYFKCLILFFVQMAICHSSFAISFKFKTSSLWSGISHVQLANDYAYCAATYGLLILDVETPDDIKIVSLVDFPSGYGRRLRVKYPYVYFADGSDGLRVIDVSVPTFPIVGGSVSFADDAMDVRVKDGLAYLAAWGDGLQIVDVSIPMAPVLIGSHAGHAQGIQVGQGTVYMASHHYGLIMYDVSNPESPVELGTCTTGGFGMGIDLRDTIAYMADFSKFTMISVEDVNQPYVIQSTPSGAVAFDIELQWPYAYLAVGDSGLSVYDLESGSPQLSARFDTPGIAAGIDVDGDRCAVSYLNGIELLDISNPSAPTHLGKYELPGTVLAAAAKGTTLAVAHGTGGLRILKLGSIGEYDLIATESSGDALDVVCRGDFALVSGSGTFRAVNLFNPSEPTVSYSRALPGVSSDLDMSENLVAVSLGDAGFAIFDIANPAQPQLRSQVDLIEPVGAVAIEGSRLAVLTTAQKTYLYDISNPSSPTMRGVVNTPQTAIAGVFRDGLLFLALGSAGIKSYNVENLQNPIALGILDTPYLASDVSLAASYLLVADAIEGVHLVNALDPLNMSIVATFDTGGEAKRAVFQQGNVLVADLIGLVVLGLENTVCGDADVSGIVTISDAVYLINYIFAGGPEPLALSAADSDCNGIITISDAVSLINYIFAGGPAPCSSCSP